MRRRWLLGAVCGLALGASSALAAPTVEYLGTGGSGSPSSAVVTFTIAANVAAGDTVEVFAGYAGSTGGAFTATDSKSQGWTCRTSWTSGSTSTRVSSCRKTNSAAMTSGVDTVSITFPTSIVAQAAAGWVIHAANTVDQFSSAAGVSINGALSGSTSASGSTSITTAQSPNATIAGAMFNGSRDVTAVTSGWTQDTKQLYGAMRIEIEHKTNAATATETYNPTTTTGGSWASETEDIYYVTPSGSNPTLMTLGVGQ